MYSYGWREYMPDIGRWNGMDQLAEDYLSASPYAYVLNNPINLFDPDGRATMAAITAAMWNETPDGSNSYWYNNSNGGFTSYDGGDKGGHAGGGSLMYGSTVSYGGIFTMGDGIYTLPPLMLTGKSSGWGNQIQSYFNSYIDKWNKPGGVYGAIQGLTSYLASSIDGFIGTTNEEFPQITDPGGLARTDFDASTWDKFRPGDKTFILDKGSFIQPASLPGGNGFGDTDNAFAEGVKNLLDLAGLFGNKSDSIWIHATIYEPYPHDTMKYVPYKGYKIESAKLNEAAKSLNEHNYKKGWHYKTYGW